MNASLTQPLGRSKAGTNVLADGFELIKFRLTSVVVFSSLASYVIASNNGFDIRALMLLCIGGFGVAGASNALNQVLEKDYDRLMRRTKNRPVTAGRMTMSTAVLIAGFLCLIGVTALAFFNLVTALLGMLAFILYAFVYTPLKRYSSIAVLIGAIAGAMPMAIGVVAFAGSLTYLALFLFAIQFAWQFPHFWSIGYLGYSDYRKAGFRLVPGDRRGPDKIIGVSAVCFSIALCGLPLIVFYTGMINLMPTILMAGLGFVYAIYSWRFYSRFDQPSARQLMFYSLVYLPLVLFVLIIAVI